uniref:Reverse transcriptase zinc-binding domain-containing protein n=1 Tax=Octopus bimaculoides TaxID=37653 RepID=A0A0L8H675_OCTBM
MCRLCRERGTLAHILAGCRITLSQGRYKYLLTSWSRKGVRNIITKGRQQP